MKKFSIVAMAIVLMSISAFAAKPRLDIVDTAVQAGTFNTLAKALKAADLVDTLKGPGPFTVFAPTDQAFSNLPPGALEVLLKPENKEQLRSILIYHVVPGRVAASDVVKLTSAKTVNGEELRISVLKGVVRLNDSRVTKTDIAASNGLIHVVDRVMMPRMGEVSQVSKIDDLLASFESKAIETRRDAAMLESKRRNPRLGWESHSSKLNLMKLHINEMGKMLAELEQMKPKATLFQEKAIEAARPHLEDLARRVEKAIGWLNEDRTSIAKAEYKDNLHGIWSDADQLYRNVDTIIDYHEARMRLHELAEDPVGR
ncbi:MAG TPA: fasciclin domain-containing protein [Terriglobales bacterium]|nr:fasciclin domain-containing protein [Terriglobales bacterium]